MGFSCYSLKEDLHHFETRNIVKKPITKKQTVRMETTSWSSISFGLSNGSWRWLWNFYWLVVIFGKEEMSHKLWLTEWLLRTDFVYFLIVCGLKPTETGENIGDLRTIWVSGSITYIWRKDVHFLKTDPRYLAF